jgi:hypothetical protein
VKKDFVAPDERDIVGGCRIGIGCWLPWKCLVDSVSKICVD